LHPSGWAFIEWKRLVKKTKIPYRFTVRENGTFRHLQEFGELYETVAGEIPAYLFDFDYQPE